MGHVKCELQEERHVQEVRKSRMNRNSRWDGSRTVVLKIFNIVQPLQDLLIHIDVQDDRGGFSPAKDLRFPFPCSGFHVAPPELPTLTQFIDPSA